MKRKDNYVMVKIATLKRVNLPNGRSLVARYKRVPRNRLSANVTIKRRYKQRPAPKNKRRRQGPRGLFRFIKKVVKIRAVKDLGAAALKEAPDLLDGISKETKKTLKFILDSDVTNPLLGGAVKACMIEWEEQIGSISYYKVKLYDRSLNYGRYNKCNE